MHASIVIASLVKASTLSVRPDTLSCLHPSDDQPAEGVVVDVEVGAESEVDEGVLDWVDETVADGVALEVDDPPFAATRRVSR